MSTTFFSLAALLVFALQVLAESHTIRFQNNCGSGTPKLIQAGKVLSTGEDYTSNGPFESAIAYLDRNGECLLNGEHCAIVEMNLNDPSCPGCGSSADISIIPSHAFNVETAFTFFGGNGDVCDGLGAICADENCNTAFFVPDDNQVQRACQADNVNLLITFCGGGSTRFTEAIAGSMSGQSSSGGPGSVVSSGNASPFPATAAAPLSSPGAPTSAFSQATVTPSPSSLNAKPSQADMESSSVAVSTTLATPMVSPTCKRRNSRARRTKRSSSLSRHSRS